VSEAEHQNQQAPSGDYRISSTNPWAHAWKMAAVLGAVGFVVAGIGYTLDPRRFAFSYLTGFITVLTMAFGGMFFVLIQHLTGAGWSVTVRRTSEFFVAGMVVVPLLALPNLLSLEQLFPWWGKGQENVAHAQPHDAQPRLAQPRIQVGTPHAPVAVRTADRGEAIEAREHVQEEQILTKKLAYLNPSFFKLRALIYLLVWLWLADRLFRYSTAQDKTGDPQWTLKLQRFAPVATILFAFSLTFAGFDWVMSLEPTWYSTMFGVRIFAASTVLGLALNILVTLGLRRAGVVENEIISVEHFHDLGKLMFGFLVFWAYISFSEFMLIWYAAIPEETVYYHHRWDFPWWQTISVMLVVVKFIIPFFLVMSRNAKRSLGLLGLGAGWIATLHLVEMYYWVMPYYSGGELPFSVTGLMTDVGCMFGCVGVYLAVVFRRMLNHPVIPARDPRLQRALAFVNA
jgi:hypothetical protein